MDQGSIRNGSAVHNLVPTVTKFCVMWERQALPHDTEFGNCRCETVDRRVIFIRSLIHGSSWSGLIKAEPGHLLQQWCQICNDYHLTLLLQETFHFSIRALDMSSLSGLKFIQHVMSFLLNMYLSLGENPMQTDQQYPRQLRHTGLIEPVFYCQDSRMTAADCCRPEFLKFNPLIHWGLLVMQLFISKLGYHWFRWWLNAYSAPYHQLR